MLIYSYRRITRPFSFRSSCFPQIRHLKLVTFGNLPPRGFPYSPLNPHSCFSFLASLWASYWSSETKPSAPRFFFLNLPISKSFIGIFINLAESRVLETQAVSGSLWLATKSAPCAIYSPLFYCGSFSG